MITLNDLCILGLICRISMNFPTLSRHLAWHVESLQTNMPGTAMQLCSSVISHTSIGHTQIQTSSKLPSHIKTLHIPCTFRQTLDLTPFWKTFLVIFAKSSSLALTIWHTLVYLLFVILLSLIVYNTLYPCHMIHSTQQATNITHHSAHLYHQPLLRYWLDSDTPIHAKPGI